MLVSRYGLTAIAASFFAIGFIWFDQEVTADENLGVINQNDTLDLMLMSLDNPYEND
jgi:hypothetical protein